MALAMGMATDIMDRPKSQSKPFPKFRAEKVWIVLFLTSCWVQSSFARILGVEVKPSITLSQMYSDNLRYQSSSNFQKEGGFITDLAPSVYLAGNSSRNQFNLNTRLQYIVYEGVDINPRFFPQLQMTSHTELYDDSVFIDSASTVGQGNGSAIGGFSAINVSAASNANSTTYSTFRISPYWRTRLGGYAEGEVRVGYSRFGNTSPSNRNGADLPTGTISDLGSDSYQQSLYFINGKQFDSTGVTWRLSFNNQQQNRHASNSFNTTNVRFQSTNGEINYRLINDISAFVQAGYYNNAYSGLGRNSPANGVYVTPGLTWKPSPHFSLSAGYGINAHLATLFWEPSHRTFLQVSYRDSKVGGSPCGNLRPEAVGSRSNFSELNNQSCSDSLGYGMGGAGFGSPYGGGDMGATSGFPTGALGSPNVGSVWNVSLRHQAKSSSWTASYFTTTTTIQEILSNDPTFTTPIDLAGNQTGDAFANNRNISLPN